MAAPSPDPVRPTGRVVVEAEALEHLLGRVRPLTAAAFLRIAVHAVPDERGVLVATTSSRAVARQFGVDKDTGAAVLKALVRAGFLRRLAQPRTGGRFAPTRYVVRPPKGVVITPAAEAPVTRPCPPPPDTTTARRRRRQTGPVSVPTRHDGARRRAVGRAGSQLGLFSPEPVATDERSAR